MSSKEAILKSIRSKLLTAADLPDLAGPWVSYPDRPAQFTAVLESVGGRCVRVADLAELNRELSQLPEYTGAKKRVSCVAGAGESNVDLDSLAAPHDLDDLDFALLPGEFGVCENGAIWVTDNGLRHRAVYFLPQHLAIAIPAASLVDNMYEAYLKLKFAKASFGTFLCGPSKTADIEQSLVIGAHGPRSLCVFLVGS